MVLACRKDGKKYILVEGEEGSEAPSFRHKKYMDKVMFLCCCCEALLGSNHEHCWWDGKIGMWPIGYYEKCTEDKCAQACWYKTLEEHVKMNHRSLPDDDH